MTDDERLAEIREQVEAWDEEDWAYPDPVRYLQDILRILDERTAELDAQITRAACAEKRAENAEDDHAHVCAELAEERRLQEEMEEAIKQAPCIDDVPCRSKKCGCLWEFVSYEVDSFRRKKSISNDRR